jgi:hypothetical protein
MPVAGDKVRASDILVRTGCRLRRAASQSINSGSSTAISWDTEDEDTDGYIAVTGTTVTIPTGLGGLYAITAHVNGVISEGGGTRSFIDIDMTSTLTGMPDLFRNPAEWEAEDMYDIAITVPLLEGDSFVVHCFHNTGSAVNHTGWLSCYRIGV